MQETISNPRLKKRNKIVGVLTFGLPFISFLYILYSIIINEYVGKFYLILTIIFYIYSVLSLEIGYHRYLSHGALKVDEILKFFLVFSGAMAISGPPIYWAATHKLHHKYSDELNDPHSPHKFGESLKGKIRGVWHSQIGWMLNNDVTNKALVAKNLFLDKSIKRIESYYLYIILFSLVLPGFISLFHFFSLKSFLLGVLYGGFFRTFLVHLFYIGGLNSICHSLGKQDFQTDDRSRNNWWMALPTMGESWHNNHHAFPQFAYLNFKWWQVDPAGYVIWISEYIGLIEEAKFSRKLIEAKRI